MYHTMNQRRRLSWVFDSDLDHLGYQNPPASAPVPPPRWFTSRRAAFVLIAVTVITLCAAVTLTGTSTRRKLVHPDWPKRPSFQGWITKEGGFVKNHKARWFVWDGHTVKYYENESCDTKKGTIQIGSIQNVRIKDGKLFVKTPNREWELQPKGEYLLEWAQIFQHFSKSDPIGWRKIPRRRERAPPPPTHQSKLQERKPCQKECQSCGLTCGAVPNSNKVEVILLPPPISFNGIWFWFTTKRDAIEEDWTLAKFRWDDDLMLGPSYLKYYVPSGGLSSCRNNLPIPNGSLVSIKSNELIVESDSKFYKFTLNLNNDMRASNTHQLLPVQVNELETWKTIIEYLSARVPE